MDCFAGLFVLHSQVEWTLVTGCGFGVDQIDLAPRRVSYLPAYATGSDSAVNAIEFHGSGNWTDTEGVSQEAALFAAAVFKFPTV